MLHNLETIHLLEHSEQVYFFGLGDAIGIRLQGVYELDSRLILMIPYALTVVVLILIGIRQRLRVRPVPITKSSIE